MLATLFFLVATAASAPSDMARGIVGDWHEDETYAGKRTMALGHFRADGTFTVEFRECLKPGPYDHVDTGHYTYANGKLRMTTETQSGFWTYAMDDYQTISNNGHVWVYKSFAGPGFQQYGAVTFHDVLVTPSSKMPSCDLVS